MQAIVGLNLDLNIPAITKPFKSLKLFSFYILAFLYKLSTSNYEQPQPNNKWAFRYNSEQ